MVSTVTPDNGSGNTDSGNTDTGGGSTPTPISLAAIAANIQAGFNGNHIAWNTINWELFSPRNPKEAAQYSESHNLSTINVFIPRSFSETLEFLQVVDSSGKPVLTDGSTSLKDELGNLILTDGSTSLMDDNGDLILTDGSTLLRDANGSLVLTDGSTPLVDAYGNPILTNGSTNLLDAFGDLILDVNGDPIPDIGNPIPDIGNTIPDIGNEIPDIGNEIPDIGNPIFVTDSDGNPIRIVDSAKDLFLAIGGTNYNPSTGAIDGDGSDHLRNKDYGFNSDNFDGPRNITGAFMGFSGDDVLYSDNLHNPMLMGGSGDDSYIIENATENTNFTQIIEHGNDNDDSVISYSNDWAFALDIDAQHMVLFDSTQEEMIVFWDYYAPEAKIENFWFDFDANGLNEHYSHDEFTAKVQAQGFWMGSLSPEELGVSRTTMYDLTTAISRAAFLSDQIENFRIADADTVRSIAQLYKAAFDRLPDTGGLNYWIDRWEEEALSLSDIADGFYNAVEFSDTYGNLSNTDYITQLYANVLDRTPDDAGAAHWGNVLDAGYTRTFVLENFSESLENQINTEATLSTLHETTTNSGEWLL